MPFVELFDSSLHFETRGGSWGLQGRPFGSNADRGISSFRVKNRYRRNGSFSCGMEFARRGPKMDQRFF